jgi:hypothetical protein
MEGGVLVEKRRVYYEGSDTIKPGYILCWNADYGTAANYDEDRMYRVEKPSASNLHRVAGVISQSQTTKSGPCMVEICLLTDRQSLLPVYTDQDCTQDSTKLFVQAGSYYAKSRGGRYLGLAAQTVDRSSTNGTVQAFVQNGVPTETVVTASSRASTQLPTQAIWSNFPLAAMRANPFLGSLLETDFRGNFPPMNTFVDATYAASAAGKTPTEHLYFGDEQVGTLELFTTTANQAVEVQFPVPITSSGTGIWAMEMRLKQTNITDDRAGWFAGLYVPSKLAGDRITDAGALADGGAIGFQKKEGDGDILDAIYDKTGESQNEHDADWATLAADTYVNVGMYYNGTTITLYKNGSSSGDAIAASDISASDFPAATVMLPSLFIKAANAADFNLSVDWVRAAWIA